ncbi:MAG: hypothetical protein D6B26_03130 [Spirochaetaceae bacterium]|nr:MAG: hypothetical protein D6B26_03130 [Spirochaetaceae bacterium]
MKKILTILIFAIAILPGCQTVPDNIPEDMTPMEFFQRGQEEVEADNLEAALMYYETFLDRYPNDYANAIIAEYWVAFIQHKKGKKAESVKLFHELLSKEAELSGRVPEWPFVLSRRVLEEMGEPVNVKDEAAADNATSAEEATETGQDQ